jgi:DNA topoisomerase-2
MTAAQMASAEAEGLDKRFKIHTVMSTTNMVCFDADGKIKKYGSPEQIIEDFYGLRLEFYIKRKVRVAARSVYAWHDSLC